jgi:hypothetical protein
MKSKSQGFSNRALVGDYNQAGSNSGLHLHRIAGGPYELADLCRDIECRVHGAFGIILVRLGISE